MFGLCTASRNMLPMGGIYQYAATAEDTILPRGWAIDRTIRGQTWTAPQRAGCPDLAHAETAEGIERGKRRFVAAQKHLW